MIPIIIQEPVTWQKIEVPPPIIRHCEEFTGLNPYIQHNPLDELRLLDCYWYNMDFYDGVAIVPPGW